jgi:hypothetical protein
MVDFSESQKQQLALYRERLRRVQHGEVWGSNHPGPYTPEEKATEIARITALIAKVGTDDA